MNRIDGYLDILPALGIELETKLDGTDNAAYAASVEIERKLKTNKNVKFISNQLGLKIVFSFLYEGEIYYFKYDSLALPENELVAYEMATRLELSCVEYDLASLGPYKGVISKNFKKEEATYLTGLDLMKDTYPKELPEAYAEYIEDGENYEELEKSVFLKEYATKQTLEDIWNALESKYKDRSDIENITKNVMREIVKRWIFYILIGNSDCNISNLMFEETPNDVAMAPIFYNARSFNKGLLTSLGIESSDKKFFDPKNFSTFYNLQRFLSIGSEEFIKEFIESLWILKPENLEYVFRMIRSKIDRNLDPLLIRYYKEFCQERLQEMKEFLKIDSLPNTKLISLEELKGLHNKTNNKCSEIATTVITPNNTVHGKLIDLSLDSHDQIFDDIAQKLFKSSAEKERDYWIQARYIIHNKNRRYALIKMPQFITPSQFERLTSLIEELKSSGFKIKSLISEFDPIKGEAMPHDRAVDLDDEDLLDYLRSHMEHVVDYEWSFTEEVALSLEEDISKKI